MRAVVSAGAVPFDTPGSRAVTAARSVRIGQHAEARSPSGPRDIGGGREGTPRRLLAIVEISPEALDGRLVEGGACAECRLLAAWLAFVGRHRWGMKSEFCALVAPGTPAAKIRCSRQPVALAAPRRGIRHHYPRRIRGLTARAWSRETARPSRAVLSTSRFT